MPVPFLSFSVTDTPSNVTATRTGYSTVELSWTAPTNNTPPVAGYEVFLAVNGSQSTMSMANTTATNVTISEGLTLGSTYGFFVVAYSDALNALPSARSETQMVELSEKKMTHCYKH